MTAPIRSIVDLAVGARAAQIERNLSDGALEQLAGLATGSLAKYLSPNPRKRLGTMSLFPILGALGKCLAVVDDPEQRALVEGRWSKRHVRGGATVQLRKLLPQPEGASIEANLEKLAEILAKLSKEERILMGASKGGKSRAKKLGRRARQRIATHAARKRWAKREQT